MVRAIYHSIYIIIYIYIYTVYTGWLNKNGSSQTTSRLAATHAAMDRACCRRRPVSNELPERGEAIGRRATPVAKRLRGAPGAMGAAGGGAGELHIAEPLDATEGGLGSTVGIGASSSSTSAPSQPLGRALKDSCLT